MEKTKNKFYHAASIVAYVISAISAFYLLVTVVGLAVSGMALNSYMEMLMPYYGGLEESGEVSIATSMAIAEFMMALSYFFALFSVVCVVMGFIVASKLRRMVYMTTEEASRFWGNSIVWIVLSFIFSGAIVGGLAVAGRCTTHRKLKNGKVETVQAEVKESGEATTQEEPVITTIDSAETENTSVESENVEDKFSDENLAKMQSRLERLDALKNEGVLSDEEYNSLRSKIINL